ncbi:hypothetical protein HY745_05205, partial [Candidatus Desantisbacteria bacterium]|nr:hypothetical protein [Candidatus Desantisbacteria bacterium]
GLGSNYIWEMGIDKKGKIWAASNNGGVAFFNGNEWQVADNNLPVIIFYSLLLSTDPFWTGTYAGLIKGLYPAENQKKEYALDIIPNTTLGTVFDSMLAAGQTELNVKLVSPIGQLIDEKTVQFYILSRDQKMYLSFETDKKSYRPGETINIAGKLENLADSYLPDVKLTMKINETGEVVFTDIFSLAGLSSHEFRGCAKITW